MNLNASGTLLAQYTAPDALANSVYTAPDGIMVEITRVVICNTTAGAGAASLFHDDAGGGTFNNTTALMFGENVPANGRVEMLTQGPNGGLHLKKGAQIGFTDSLSGGLTISIYGITQHLTGRSL